MSLWKREFKGSLKRANGFMCGWHIKKGKDSVLVWNLPMKETLRNSVSGLRWSLIGR